MYPLDFWGYKGFAFDKHDFKAWIIGGVILGEPRISVSPSGKKEIHPLHTHSLPCVATFSRLQILTHTCLRDAAALDACVYLQHVPEMLTLEWKQNIWGI